MFNGDFKEGLEQAVDITEKEVEVSVASFEILLQWLHLGRINVPKLSYEETVTYILEFARTADIYGVSGMENTMAAEIKLADMSERYKFKLGTLPRSISSLRQIFPTDIQFVRYWHVCVLWIICVVRTTSTCRKLKISRALLSIC
jgi:hypothetical protein